MLYSVISLNAVILITLYLMRNKVETKKIVSIASFSEGIFQVLLIFLIFLFVFKYSGSNEYIAMPVSITIILIADIISIHLYLLFLYLYIQRMKIHYSGNTVLSDYLQVFIPSILLNSALILIIHLDIPVNREIYSMIISQLYVIILFKSIYVLCNMVIINVISSKNKCHIENESVENS